MPEASLTSLLESAGQHLRAGRLVDAKAMYEQILGRHPNHPLALNSLGLIYSRLGEPLRAVELMRQSTAIDPGVADYHGYLGNVLLAQGDFAAAADCFDKASALKPDSPDGHNCLGFTLHKLGRFEDAEREYRIALTQKPADFAARNNLGLVLREAGRPDEAIVCFRKALALRPDFIEAFKNILATLQTMGRYRDAVTVCQHAVTLDPSSPRLLFELGIALEACHEYDPAIAAFEAAIRMRPDWADVHNALGHALHQQGKLDLAIKSFQRAIDLSPQTGQIHSNLGNVHFDSADFDTGIESYRKAISLSPDDAVIHSNLVYALHFHPAYDAEAIFKEHQVWNARHAAPLAPEIIPHANPRQPEKRLRIGYVSPDFRWHAVGRLLLPLLEHHDRDQFEIFCYSGVAFPDEMTGRFQKCAQVWRNITGMPDARVAELIRRDQIDILIDLSMHMSGNRLLVFARKPAPVQISYLAYCGTTGMDAMDYRITDPHFDPVDQEAVNYSEKSLYLPKSYWCCGPIEQCEVSPLPALSKGYVTFGSFNNFNKVSSAALSTWAKILIAVPHSRLILHSPEGNHRQHVRNLLAGQGFDSDRIEFVGRLPFSEYVQQYSRVDIALDSFPYCGGTTSLDASWMGVPVITLRGKTAVGRSGVSILTNLGLPELIASDPREYVRIAAALTVDLARVAELRASLRQRMRESPLMDAERFAKEMESLYRTAWKSWCASGED